MVLEGSLATDAALAMVAPACPLAALCLSPPVPSSVAGLVLHVLTSRFQMDLTSFLRHSPARRPLSDPVATLHGTAAFQGKRSSSLGGVLPPTSLPVYLFILLGPGWPSPKVPWQIHQALLKFPGTTHVAASPFYASLWMGKAVSAAAGWDSWIHFPCTAATRETVLLHMYFYSLAWHYNAFFHCGFSPTCAALIKVDPLLRNVFVMFSNAPQAFLKHCLLHHVILCVSV